MSLKIVCGGLFAADLSSRRGTEPGKVRPVAVVQNDLLNEVGHPSTFILPCTTNLTGESILRVELPRGIAGNTRDCEIMIDQGRAVDNRRLRKGLGALPRSLLEETRTKLRQLPEL